MNINVSDKIIGYDGKVLLLPDGKEQWTYRRAIQVALNNFTPDESPVAEDKLLAYELTKRVYETDMVDLKAEEAAFIKIRVAKVHNPVIVGRIEELMEQKGSEE